jgi:hypothetical protein
MVRIPVRKEKRESGQAILLVVLAMSLFMLGALGFIIDGSHLYAQRTMAQAAADAAAQAGMMSIFDNTAGAWGAHTVGASFTCGTGDAAAACKYAQSTANGFSLAGDVVTVTPNPAGVAVTGLSSADSVNLLEVTVQRKVNTTLMNLIGSSGATIKAVGIAAILQVVSPVPMIITDPISSGSLSMNGSTSITICGGPTQSIQINSSSSTAYTGGGTVDLSHAGPADTTGNCTTGTGANFGVFGGDATKPGSVQLGSTGKYVSPSSPIQDPLAGVAAPTIPANNGGMGVVATGTDGCTSSSCYLLTPGLWTGGISVPHPHDTLIFAPGVYYINGGGFDLKNGTAFMCSSCPADPNTGNGMVIYDTSSTTKKVGTLTCDVTGGFTIDTGVTATLLGAGVSTATPPTAPSGPYYGILFFEDRNACAQTHSLGQGNGCFSLTGTVYITNTLAFMQAGIDQSVSYNGTPCSATINQGEIIVSDLSLVGNTSITMGLYPTGFLKIRQVALVD